MGSRKLTFFWRFKGTSDVLRARMGECKRMLSWVAESKRSSDDLKDLLPFLELEWTNEGV